MTVLWLGVYIHFHKRNVPEILFVRVYLFCWGGGGNFTEIIELII
jgi:hypothetical protein